MINISRKIKQFRVEKDMTQGYLAQRLGMSRATYIQLENGLREPTLSDLDKTAKTFGVSLSVLLEISPSPLVPEITLEEPANKVVPTKERISVPREQVNKFKEVLLYLLERVGAKAHVGQTVIYKLLYFIDFDYYEKFEEQLIGAKYIKNHHGPTPVSYVKIIEEMKSKNEIEEVKSKYFQYEQTKYLPRRNANLNLITAQEIKHIDEVLARLGDKNAADLSTYSHKDVPWISAKEGEALDYEAVFYRTQETSVRNYEGNRD